MVLESVSAASSAGEGQVSYQYRSMLGGFAGLFSKIELRGRRGEAGLSMFRVRRGAILDA